MRKSILFGLLFVLVFSSRAQDKDWTLQQCIQYALDNNISIKQSGLDVALSEIGISEAVGNLLPRLNASASNSWNTGLTQNVTTGILQSQTTRSFSAGVTASLTLFDGLRNIKNLQLAKLAQLASEYSLELMKDDITLLVANSYLQVLFNKETLKVLEAQQAVSLEQLERVNILVEAGAVPSGDLLEIKAAVASGQQQIVVARNNVKISLIALAQTLLIEDYENFDIADQKYEVFGGDILEISVPELIEKAATERYEIRIARTRLDMAEKQKEIAKGAFWPSLGAFFNYNTRETGMGMITGGSLDPDEPYRQIGIVESTQEPVVAPNMVSEVGNPLPFFDQLQNNDGISYGVQLTIPLFNGLATRNQVKRREIEVLRSANALQQAKLDLEADVYQAYTDARGALEAYEASLVALEAQLLAYDYATARYQAGLTNAFEFNQAQFDLQNAQSEVIRTKYDYIFNLKVLELYFGVPVSALKF